MGDMRKQFGSVPIFEKIPGDVRPVRVEFV